MNISVLWLSNFDSVKVLNKLLGNVALNLFLIAAIFSTIAIYHLVVMQHVLGIADGFAEWDYKSILITRPASIKY